MKVHELIAELENMDEDAEVRLAIQPGYPFQHDVESVIEVEVNDRPGPDVDELEEQLNDLRAALQDEEDDEHPGNQEAIAGLKQEIKDLMVAITKAEDEATTIVYIAEGGQHYSAPYLPGKVAEELGWR